MQNLLVIISLLFFVASSCSNKSEENTKSSGNSNSKKKTVWQVDKKTIQGETQGTTFIIKTSEDSLLVSTKEIKELFAGFDNEMSGYISTSLLSKLNDTDTVFYIENDNYFTDCYNLSQQVYQKTNGAFDPSVFPLVKAWGFFKDMSQIPSKEQVDSILKFTGFKERLHHTYKDGVFEKIHPNFKLDFNAIAQGQSADVIANFLTKKGHKNYFIEVGGEIVVKGINDEQKPWTIGIDQPKENNNGQGNRSLENYLSISNGGLATSGNYRKFYELNGKKYSHTLNPKTGYPVKHNLLSTTVIAENAALADAYATAFMTMGLDKTMEFLKQNEDLKIDVYLLFENDSGRIERAFTPGMKKYFLN